jgi:hypothetical protein
MSRAVITSCALAIAFLTSTVFAALPLAKGPAKGKDGKDDIVGAVWTYTLAKGDERSSGQFRVNDNVVYKGPKKVGTVEVKDNDETTITFTDWDEMNGVAKLRKNKREPVGASGKLTKKDGSEWAMKVTWKDG